MESLLGASSPLWYKVYSKNICIPQIFADFNLQKHTKNSIKVTFLHIGSHPEKLKTIKSLYEIMQKFKIHLSSKIKSYKIMASPPLLAVFINNITFFSFSFSHHISATTLSISCTSRLHIYLCVKYIVALRVCLSGPSCIDVCWIEDVSNRNTCKINMA